MMDYCEKHSLKMMHDLDSCPICKAESKAEQLQKENERYREALKGIAESDMDEAGCYYTNRFNIKEARKVLKGGEA